MLAWDCATGNGQAACSLAAYFDTVIATDASDRQIRNAVPSNGVEYRVAHAEASGLAAASADLVTVAQAIHWFDIDAFFSEAARVLKPGGVVAFWCYHHCSVDVGCDRVIRAVYDDVEDYWPPERDLVENRYADIGMPFEALPTRDFQMRTTWSAGQVLSYLRTWSAVRRCMAATGEDPVARHAADLQAAWGEGRRSVAWPLILQMGRR